MFSIRVHLEPWNLQVGNLIVMSNHFISRPCMEDNSRRASCNCISFVWRTDTKRFDTHKVNWLTL